MPVLDIQARLRELGRLRMGDKGGKGQPQKLETWRLTSADETMLKAASGLYGGTVRPWGGQPGQFELYTESKELPIVVAPMDISQWYEQWSAAGCTHRCDGLSDNITGNPCSCDPEARACKLTTRFSVMLYELPGLGVWRLESHGYYAATELPPTAHQLIIAARAGRYMPVRLAIEEHSSMREGKIRRYVVPVLRVDMSLKDVLQGRGGFALPAGEVDALPPASADDDGVVIEPEIAYMSVTFEAAAIDRLTAECERLGVAYDELAKGALRRGITSEERLMTAARKLAGKEEVTS